MQGTRNAALETSVANGHNYTRPPPPSDLQLPPPLAHTNHRCMGTCAVPPNIPHTHPAQPPRAHQHHANYAYQMPPGPPPQYIAPNPVFPPFLMRNWMNGAESGSPMWGSSAHPPPHHQQAPPPPPCMQWDPMTGYRRGVRDATMPLVPPPPPYMQQPPPPPPAHSTCHLHGAQSSSLLQGEHAYGAAAPPSAMPPHHPCPARSVIGNQG